MNSGLIATGLVSHVPSLGYKDRIPEYQRELAQGITEMGDKIRDLKPDLLVLHSAHWMCTFDWYVTAHDRHKGVCVADEAPDLIGGIPYDRPGDPEFARALSKIVNEKGITLKLNESPNYHLDYASLVPMLYLDPEQEIPYITLPSVLCARLDECMRIGQIVAETASRINKRIIYIASCALSHKLKRGRENWPTEERMKMDNKIINLFCNGEVSQIEEWLPEYSKKAVAEMEGRPLSGMVGAMKYLSQQHSRLSGKKYGPYTQSSGTGNANLLITPA